MNNASSALKVAASIFLTIALITIVVILFISAQEATKTAQNNFRIFRQSCPGSIYVYDGTTISGSQVTKLYKAGGNAGNGIVRRTVRFSMDSRQGNIELVMDEKSPEYVNPSGKFKATIVKDDSNVIRGH